MHDASVPCISPDEWADRNGLQIELDNDGQKIIYLSDKDADQLSVPDGAGWDTQKSFDGTGWVIYTDEFQKEDPAEEITKPVWESDNHSQR